MQPLTAPDGPQDLAKRLSLISLAAIAGAVIGLIAIGFFELVQGAASVWTPALPKDWASAPAGYSLVLGVALFAAALIAGFILSLLHQHRPQGPADLIHAAQTGRLPDLKTGFLSSLLALSNLCGGASVGVFGPLVHLGGCLNALLLKGQRHFPIDMMLGAGAAAAIAAVFSAPIGAAIFAYETIIRRFGNFGAAPVLAATFAAYWAGSQVLGDHRIFSGSTSPSLDPPSLGLAALIGIACALACIVYIHLVTTVPRWANKTAIPIFFRPLVPASLLFLISPWLPHLLGTGLSSAELALAGELALGLLIVLIIAKIMMTSLCLGFGFFGGVVSPALFFGMMIGAVADQLIGTGSGSVTQFALVGAASCMAAVIGAPIAAVVMILEITGSYEWAVLSMVSVLTTSQITRSFMGRSLWDRQLTLRGLSVDGHRPGPRQSNPF
jgi:CIC family chloride channel protein